MNIRKALGKLGLVGGLVSLLNGCAMLSGLEQKQTNDTSMTQTQQTKPQSYLGLITCPEKNISFFLNGDHVNISYESDNELKFTVDKKNRKHIEYNVISQKMPEGEGTYVVDVDSIMIRSASSRKPKNQYDSGVQEETISLKDKTNPNLQKEVDKIITQYVRAVTDEVCKEAKTINLAREKAKLAEEQKDEVRIIKEITK